MYVQCLAPGHVGRLGPCSERPVAGQWCVCSAAIPSRARTVQPCPGRPDACLSGGGGRWWSDSGVCVCVFVCECVNVCMCMCLSVYVCVCGWVGVCRCECVCVRVRVRVDVL